MPRNCTINFNNPVTGRRHPSLIGYMLNQNGISEDNLQAVLDAGFEYTESGAKTWGNKTSQSPYVEPNINTFLEKLDIEADPNVVSYISRVQDFYDQMNLSIGTRLNLAQVRELYKEIPSNISLEVEAVDPSVNILERQYKVFPIPYTDNSFLDFGNFVYNEVYNMQVELGQPNALQHLTKFVDLLEPNIYNTINRILNDPSTTKTQKDILKTLLSIQQFAPDITLQITSEVLYDYEGSISASLYNPENNSIVFNLAALGMMSADNFKKLIIHEFVHAAFYSVLDNPVTQEEKIFASEVKKIYEYYKDKYKDKEPLGDFYGLQDQQEFLSEFLSNPTFRESLESVSPEVHGSFIQSMLNLFKKFFNKFIRKNNYAVSKEYLDILIKDMVVNVLDNKSINTSRIYTPAKPVASRVNTAEYNRFLEEMPYNDSNIFFERLKEFLESDAVNWSQVYREANKTGVNLFNITTAQEHLDRIIIDDITRTDLKNSFESLVQHFSETIAFLRSVNRNIEELKNNKSISEKDFYTRSFHAAQLGQFFKDYVSDFKSFMYPGAEKFPAETIIGRSLNNIESIANLMLDNFNNNAANSIAKRLAEEIHPQTENLRKQIEREIARLEGVVAKADTTAVKNNANLKLKKERERLDFLATPKNLEKALLGSFKLDKGTALDTTTNYISSLFESAALTGNLISGPVATLVSNLWSKSTQEALAFEGRMKKIADRLQKYNKSKGKRATTSLDFQSVFGDYVEKVKILEIKRGQLEERDTYAFLSEFNEIEYWNDWTRKKYEINKLESKKGRTQEEDDKLQSMIDDLIAFEDLNKKDLYTPEYYRIQSLLSDEAKAARQSIIDEMRKIQLTPVQGEQSEEDLDRLDDLKSQLTQLESDYDEYGVLKTGQELDIAKNIREWKSERAAANLFVYEISERDRAIFDGLFESKKQAVQEAQQALANAQLQNNSENLQIAQRKYAKAIKDLETFKRSNVVKKIDPTFYEERRDIIDAISAIQSKYPANISGRSVQDVYEELFALLRPYKNQNGEYEGSSIRQEKVEYVDAQGNTVTVNLPQRVKQLQDEIEDIRQEISENVNISRADKDALKSLYIELSGMQDRVTTDDYDKTKLKNIAKIRSKVIASLPGNIEDYTSEQIAKKVDAELKKTDWYKDNHRLVYDYNLKKKVYEPTFQWMVTLPTNPDYILETEPSFRWYNINVNSDFVNQDVKENRFSKRVSLKNSSLYKNKKYAKLDAEQKAILKEITEIYEEQQKGLPKNLLKGLELPSVRKSGLEGSRATFGTIGSQVSGMYGNIVDSIMGRDDEDLSEASLTDRMSSKTDSQMNRYKNRVYMKFVRPIDADQMTINFIESVGQFGAESIRFKNMYKELPYLLGVRDLVDKNVRGTTAKVINNLLERRLNGQNKVAMSNVGFIRAIEWGVDKSLSLGANMALSLNLPSSIKNFQAGSTNIYAQMNRFGISKKDITKYMAMNGKRYFELFNAQVEEGANTPYMTKMKYFSVMPDDTLSDTGKKLYLTSLDKSKKFNPLSHLSFVRNFGEFEMRSSVAEALAEKFLIELNNGQFVKILDAYEVQGNTLIPREDIKDIDNFSKVEQYYRNQLNLVNSLIHGAYGTMDKADYTRYTLGRLVMYMKNWLGYQYLSRFGSRRMSYSAGMEFEGMYRTVWNSVRLLVKNRFNFAGTSKILSNMEKENLFSAMIDTIVLSATMAIAKMLAAAVYSDDDDDMDNDLAYYSLFSVLYLEDELSSLHPIALPKSIWYSRVENNVDGKSIFEYYVNRTFSLPFRGLTDILGSVYDFSPLGEIDMFDDYVPRSRTGKVLNPKRYIRDPFLKGKPEIVARLAKLWALDKTVNTFYGGQEFLYRRYEYSNPKWYTSSYETDLRAARKGAASAKKEIKSIERELKYVEDYDTQETLRDRIDELKNTIKRSEEKEEIIKGEFENIDRM